MLALSLNKELAAIVESLCGSYHEVVLGLATLDLLLLALVPLLRKHQSTGVLDPPLASLVSSQDNFQFNLVSALIQAYRTFDANPGQVEEDQLRLANHLLQGLLLIHPELRRLFARKSAMLLMLLFLDPKHALHLLDVCTSFVSLLVPMLLKNVRNMRVFEACGGCLLVIRQLQFVPDEDSGQKQTLYFKVIEFLIFYLTDETPLHDLPENADQPTLTIGEKADLFRPDFPGINDLIDHLRDLRPL